MPCLLSSNCRRPSRSRSRLHWLWWQVRQASRCGWLWVVHHVDGLAPGSASHCCSLTCGRVGSEICNRFPALAGPPTLHGGPRVVLEFHPAGNDSFCSAGAPQIAIPSFIQMRQHSRHSGRSAAAGIYMVVLKPPPLPALIPLAAPPPAAPVQAPDVAAVAAGGVGMPAAAAEGAAASTVSSQLEPPALPSLPLQRLRVPSAASSQPSVLVGGPSQPSASPSSRPSSGGPSSALRSSRSGTAGTPRSAVARSTANGSQLAPATPHGGDGLPAPAAASTGRGSGLVQSSPTAAFAHVLEVRRVMLSSLLSARIMLHGCFWWTGVLRGRLSWLICLVLRALSLLQQDTPPD